MGHDTALVCLAYACLAAAADASWSVYVRDCVPEDGADCEPALLVHVNETIWTSQLSLSYIVEAGWA